MNQGATRITLVEDDAELARWVSDYLQQHEMAVQVADRGDTAVELIEREPPDLVLLDLMLPGKDGHQVCREIRAFYNGPVLILTANDEELDEVLSLEIGADDFVSKPVRPRILLARIKALLRRSAPASESQREQLAFGSLSIDASARSVRLGGNDVALSNAEFDLLWLLAQQAGEVINRRQLVQQLRGFDYDGFDRTVDVRISRLRKKLGDTASTPERIKTIWGKGYLFVPSAW